jgi:hypothetical protein
MKKGGWAVEDEQHTHCSIKGVGLVDRAITEGGRVVEDALKGAGLVDTRTLLLFLYQAGRRPHSSRLINKAGEGAC